VIRDLAGLGRRPVTRAAPGPARRGALPRTAGFWLVAGVLFLLLFVSGAASPLYDVYQAQWRFSATTLTAIFSVYVLAFLVTLLVFGSVSDYLGRRGVIAVGLVVGAGACGLFLAAHGAGLLFAARALSGVSAGAFHEAFPDREAFLLAAIELGVERARRRMAAAYDAETRWLDAVKGALVAFLWFLEQEPALGRLLVVYSLSGGEQVLRRRVEIVAVLQRVRKAPP